MLFFGFVIMGDKTLDEKSLNEIIREARLEKALKLNKPLAIAYYLKEE